MELNHRLERTLSMLLLNKTKELSNTLEFAKLLEANTTKISSLTIIQQFGEVGITSTLVGVIVAAIQTTSNHIAWESRERKKLWEENSRQKRV